MELKIVYDSLFMFYLATSGEIARATGISRKKVNSDANMGRISYCTCMSIHWKFYTIKSILEYYQKIKGEAYPGKIILCEHIKGEEKINSILKPEDVEPCISDINYLKEALIKKYVKIEPYFNFYLTIG